jgi:hypothetical protein
MPSFVQRYRAIEDHDVPAHTSASASTHKKTGLTRGFNDRTGNSTELALEDQVATS